MGEVSELHPFIPCKVPLGGRLGQTIEEPYQFTPDVACMMAHEKLLAFSQAKQQQTVRPRRRMRWRRMRWRRMRRGYMACRWARGRGERAARRGGSRGAGAPHARASERMRGPSLNEPPAPSPLPSPVPTPP